MHVYFCGRDIFMSQHHLYGPQVGTSFEQMSGKAVTEGVRTDILLYTSPFGIVLDIYKQTYSAQSASSGEGYEYVILFRWFHLVAHSGHKPFAHSVNGHSLDGHKSLLAAFSLHPYVFVFQIQLTDTEIAEFADTESAAIQYLYDGSVPDNFRLAHIDDTDDTVYHLHTEYLRQVLAYLRTLQ